MEMFLNFELNKNWKLEPIAKQDIGYNIILV